MFVPTPTRLCLVFSAHLLFEEVAGWSLARNLLAARSRRIPRRPLCATTLTSPHSSLTAAKPIEQTTLTHQQVKLGGGSSTTDDDAAASSCGRVLIHWKGENVEGYSISLRHLELQGALSAVVATRSRSPIQVQLAFENALNYTGSFNDGYMPEHKHLRFNHAMQYMRVVSQTPNDDCNDQEQSNSVNDITVGDVVQAIQRCSLVHAAYLTVAAVSSPQSYEDLGQMALRNGGLDDLKAGESNQDATWCVRVRHYGSRSSDPVGDDDQNNKSKKKEKRHGHRARSVSLERVALEALKPLLLTFGGGVDLKRPDCKLYVMDGCLMGVSTEQQQKHEEERQPVKLLVRRLAAGPRISGIAPATRLCVTNTPLCPMAAYCLCNAAQLKPGDVVLDPYAGSCTTLLAAACIEPTVKSVAIEIAHNGLVNRDDIVRDFETRNLPLPVALLQGDSMDPSIRQLARDKIIETLRSNNDNSAAVGDARGAFDCIIADPPYGIRESTNYNDQTPIQELLQAIKEDRAAGQRLLRVGGKLVCFLPCLSPALDDREREQGNPLWEKNVAQQMLEQQKVLPLEGELGQAGLQLSTQPREQFLNDSLSRWLVVMECVD